MSRAIIAPRSLISTPRRLVLPVGMKGRASLWFDGVDDTVVGVSPALGTGAWTIAGYCNPRPKNASDGVFLIVGNVTAANSIAIYQTGNVFGALLGGIEWVSSGVACDNIWHRVVVTFPGGTGRMRVYVDGVFRAQSAADRTPNIASVRCTMGYPGLYQPCNMSDWRAYMRKWSDAEVAADYRGEWVDPTGLVRWWTCENPGYGTTCHEEIGNTEDAITGATWSPNVPFRRRRIVEDVASCPLFAGGPSLDIGRRCRFVRRHGVDSADWRRSAVCLWKIRWMAQHRMVAQPHLTRQPVPHSGRRCPPSLGVLHGQTR
jgi:hypothetical protein